MIAVWCLLLTALIGVAGLAIGFAIRLPGWSVTLALAAAGRLALTSVLTTALTMPFAWAASAGRDYLPAVGTLFGVLVLAQVLAADGRGALFPWSVPALLIGIAGPSTPMPGLASYVSVLLTRWSEPLSPDQ